MHKLGGGAQPQEYTVGPPSVCSAAKSRRLELLMPGRALRHGSGVSLLLSCGIGIPPSFDISAMRTVPRELSFIMARTRRGKIWLPVRASAIPATFMTLNEYPFSYT